MRQSRFLKAVGLALVVGLAMNTGRMGGRSEMRQSYREDLVQTHKALTRQAFTSETAGLAAEHQNLLVNLARAPFDQAYRDELKTRYAGLRKVLPKLRHLNEALVALPGLSMSHSLKDPVRLRTIKALQGVHEDLNMGTLPQTLVRSLEGIFVVVDQEQPQLAKTLATFSSSQVMDLRSWLETAEKAYQTGDDLLGNAALLSYLESLRVQADLLEQNLYTHLEKGHVLDAHRISMKDGYLETLQRRLCLPVLTSLQEINRRDDERLMAHNRALLGLPEPGQIPVLKAVAIQMGWLIGFGVLIYLGLGFLEPDKPNGESSKKSA